MAQPWHVANAALKEEVQATLRELYPNLVFQMQGDVACVLGSFPVMDGDVVLDRFAIQMSFPDNYPDELPVVYEVGDRLPWVLDRHVNINGTTCLQVPDEWFILAEDQSFAAFMAGPVRNYFLGQALVEAGHPWPFGERKHGYQGLVQSYEELLGVGGREAIFRYLTLLERGEIKGHWDCPCGSGETLRRCHLADVRALQQKISPKNARRMRERIKLMLNPYAPDSAH